MSSCGYHQIQYRPCANCGKKNGTMSSTAWGHGHLCCGEACGKRLGKRIQNGMVDIKERFPWFLNKSTDEVRISDLRNRVKHLENQLKRNGIKPMGMKYY
jgi:hypothetical protein